MRNDGANFRDIRRNALGRIVGIGMDEKDLPRFVEEADSVFEAPSSEIEWVVIGRAFDSFFNADPPPLDTETRAAFAAFARLPQLARLRRLSVAGGAVDGEIARLLADSPFLGRLTRLDLDYCRIGPGGVEAVVGSSNLSGLTELNVTGTSWPDGAGICPDSYMSNIGPEGVMVLAGLPGSGRLRILNINQNGAGHGGALALATSPYLDGLEGLHVSRYEVYDPDGAAVRALRDRFGPRWIG